jgi:hypothetical protein
MVVLVFSLLPAKAFALVGAHTHTNSTTGDVFLGGDYIELGISKRGSFGTTASEPKPSGFYGSGSRTNIGMSTNAAGFGVSPDTRIDFFLPGTPEERWVVGYKVAGTPHIGSNSLLMNANNISNNVVTNQSSGNQLKAVSDGTFDSKLKITQNISFNVGDKFFKNEVTLKNVDSAAIDSVRYMRTFDPDNTGDRGGSSQTRNKVLYTFAAGDGKAVVMADTSNNANDPVYLVNGSRSPILFYTNDSRARASAYGFSNADPYAADAYDSAKAKNYSIDADQAITLTVDAGTLAAGAQTKFTYYTSLDERDFADVLEDIEEDAAAPVDDGDDITATVEDAAPNSGDGNADGLADSEQANVTSLPNAVVGGSAYQTVQAAGCEELTSVGVNASGSYGADGDHVYPVGLTSFNAACDNPGDTATMTIFYDKQYDTANWKARKFVGGVYRDLPGAVFGTATVGGKTVTTLTYSVTDGSVLDADGTANGEIVDPAGPSVLAASTTLADAGTETLVYTLISSAILVAAVATRFWRPRRTETTS